MKKIILILTLITAIAIALLYFNKEASSNKNTNELKLYGNVEIRQVLLGFRVGGRLEEVYFEEGQIVNSGDLLARLDSLPYELKKIEAGSSLSQANANLQKLEKGNRNEEIKQAVAKRDQVLASLTLAEKDYARLANLFEQKAIAKKDLDSILANRDTLRAQFAAAEDALKLMREGFRTEDIKAAEAGAEMAKANLRQAEMALADTRLYAPSEGTILTRIAEPGTIVAIGQPVYAVALKKPVLVRTYVSEAQLGQIQLGMKGRIYTDSFKDPLIGSVNFIASEAEFTPKQVQTENLRTDLVYRIRLLVEENPEERLKNGMPVTIMLDKK